MSEESAETREKNGIFCRHCGERMKRYSVSPFDYSDGLGFGSSTLHVCFNDHCPPYVAAWSTMKENYGRTGSVRYFYNPAGDQDGVLPVGNRDAMRGDTLGDVPDTFVPER
ncbi:MAG: hypothetical protein HQL50_09730 [Magnetococcales bacterium]|nr:hypothetical protein [Magnetococcales bacterium]